MRIAIVGLTAAVLLMGLAPSLPDPVQGSVDIFLGPLGVTPASAQAVEARCDDALNRAGLIRKALETDTRPASVETVFVPYDALYNLLAGAFAEVNTLNESNPSEPIRKAAQVCVQKLSDVTTGVGLSRPIYDRLAAIPTARLNAGTAYALKKRLAAYRLSGVDKDEATRAKIEKLQKEITATGLTFASNIRENPGAVKFKPEELAGLPQDWLDAHKPGPDGLITVTTNYPDVFPVLEYADNPETRRRMQSVFDNLAWPANEAVLKQLLTQRYELARLLGFPNYAALVMSDKMIGSPERAGQFLEQVNIAAQPGAEKDRAILLARLKKIDPKATVVDRWSVGYLSRLVRKEDYQVDSAVVRGYFTYDRTRDGIFQLVEDLFGVQIRPWQTATWHESVKAYELVENGQVIGRFFLDMHPREGKFNHAAMFPLRNGIEGRSLPIASLLCNFPATGPLDHEDAETFLHEFGHLLHWMFSGRQKWAQQNFAEMEWDFVEAPSQMLEEWVWDYDTLKRFAVNEKGEPIPEDLVRKMNAARRFGEPGMWKGQITYSAISLNYYNRDPAGIDLAGVWKEQYQRYGLYPYVEGSHQYAAFGHLDGYSAIYYTYIWSKAIALDLHTVFAVKGLRDADTARRYRREVLAPGGSKPAGDLIQTFVGRPMSVEALERRLKGE